jgi:hypothetical protein
MNRWKKILPQLQEVSTEINDVSNVPKEKHEKMAMHIAHKFHGSGIDEEVEQIDELSLDALDNYKRKAGKRLRSLSPQYNWSPDSPVKKEIDKRVKGYRQAWQKIEDKL